MMISNVSDCLILPSNIDKFHNVCIAKNLFVNVDKFKTLKFGRIPFNYAIDKHTLEKVNEIRDLGIFFGTKLIFVNYVKCRPLGPHGKVV